MLFPVFDFVRVPRTWKDGSEHSLEASLLIDASLLYLLLEPLLIEEDSQLPALNLWLEQPFADTQQIEYDISRIRDLFYRALFRWYRQHEQQIRAAHPSLAKDSPLIMTQSLRIIGNALLEASEPMQKYVCGMRSAFFNMSFILKEMTHLVGRLRYEFGTPSFELFSYLFITIYKKHQEDL
jgi:hypothetical protein